MRRARKTAPVTLPVPRSPLDRTIALTRAGLLAERGLRAFWPLLSVLGVVFAVLAFRLPQALDETAGRGLGAVALLLVLATLGWGLLRFRWPTVGDARARLDATLPGRPLTALADHMALGQGDAAARALWSAHVARMQRVALAARPVRPNPDLAPRDPYALRLTALTAVVMALLFGAPLALFSPLPQGSGVGPAQAAMGPAWEGWAAPPRYTGKPGLYLNKVDTDTITVPQGTRFAFRFYGKPGAVPFEETVSNPAAAKQDAPKAPAETSERNFDAVQTGMIRIGGAGGRTFQVAILPDAVPQVQLTGQAERRADGKFVQPFHASDDYGVTAGHARITLDLAAVDRRFGRVIDPEPRDDLVFDLPLPISGTRTAFDAQLVEDVSKHAWANLPVRLTLDVEDGLGQTGTSAVQDLVLPGKRFFDPRAAALIEVRQDLLWNRANAPRDAQILRAIANRPGDIFPQPAMGVVIKALALTMDAPDPTPETRDELSEMLWQMATLLEDGGLSGALAAMQQAQERLSEAIRNGASDDEIAKLMQDLKAATDNYLKMLAERSQDQQGPKLGKDMPRQNVTGQQIQQMMDAIKKAMEEGRMADAQEMLDQLSRLMQNMKVTQGEGGDLDIPGARSMKDLQDTLRKQQDLSDDAFKDMQQGQGGDRDISRQDIIPPGAGDQQGDLSLMPGENAQGENADKNGGGPSQTGPEQPGASGTGQDQGQAGALADRQGALRQELERQRALMPHLDGQAGDEAQKRLDDALRAMDQAEQALRDGDNGTAIDRQAEAIDALREGMRSAREALNDPNGTSGQRQRGEDRQGEQRMGDATGGRGPRELPRDPLGRASGEGSQAGTESDMMQSDIYGRARALLDEIRRRSAERQRPQDELDYLGRLLDRF